MILNSYAVLDAFVSLLRLGLGVLILWLGIAAWRMGRAGAGDGRRVLEDRCYLIYQLAGLLLGLNVMAWPLWYLLLQSYVPEWPGVMCIYGVTRIGSGSIGPSRFLPSLVTGLEVAKPGLVFLSGAWFILYLVNRGTRTGPLTVRLLLVLLGSVVLAVADAAAELAYLAIPKKEEFLSAGCCTGAFDAVARSGRWLPGTWVGDNVSWLYTAYYVANIGMVVMLYNSRKFSGVRWAMLLVGAVLSLVVNVVFLMEAAAPRLLHLPFHHCPYDLVPAVPESMLAVALFLGGCFAVGWAGVVSWLGQEVEARPGAQVLMRGLLYLGWLGYLGSVVMMTVELLLA